MIDKTKTLDYRKKHPNDELYTRYEDIEAMCETLKDELRGKYVLCCCDDPRWSQFVRYFAASFEDLGLRKLVAVHYAPAGIDAFDGPDAPAGPLVLEMRRPAPVRLDEPWDACLERIGRVEGNSLRHIRGDGSFDSPFTARCMDECDIVATNPPFSRMMDFVDAVLGRSKDLLVIAPLTFICYSKVNPYFIGRNGKRLKALRAVKAFRRPDGTEQKLGNTYFFSTIGEGMNTGAEPDGRTEWKVGDYVRMDDCDALLVNATKDIPMGYTGRIGVPQSALTKRWVQDAYDVLGHVKPVIRNDDGTTKEYFERIILQAKVA